MEFLYEHSAGWYCGVLRDGRITLHHGCRSSSFWVVSEPCQKQGLWQRLTVFSSARGMS